MRFPKIRPPRPAAGYPMPEMRERMRGIRPGVPPSGPAGASSANTPPPAPEETDRA